MTDKEPEKKTYKIIYQSEEVIFMLRDRSGDEEE